MLKVTPRASYLNGRVVDVDGIVHVTNGKIVCFDEEKVYDFSDESEVSRFDLFGRELYEIPLMAKAYGDDTVCVVFLSNVKSSESPSGFERTIGLYKFSDLSDSMRARLMEVCDAYDR